MMINSVNYWSACVCQAMIYNIIYGVVFYLLYVLLSKFRIISATGKHLTASIGLLALFILFFKDIYSGVGFLENNALLDSSILISNAIISNAIEISSSQNFFVPYSFRYGTFFSLTYMTGASFFLVRIYRDQRNLNRLVRGLGEEVPKGILSLFSELKVRFDLSNLELRITRFVDSPAVLGMVNPIILLPYGRISELHISQIKSILLHEIAHVLRSDFFINYLNTLISAVLFFNPFVHMFRNIASDQMEIACDEMVLSNPDQCPIDYANLLLELAASKPSINADLMVNLVSKRQKLLRRILILTSGKNQNLTTKHMYSSFWGFACTALIAILFITSSLNGRHNFKTVSNYPKQKQFSKKVSKASKTLVKKVRYEKLPLRIEISSKPISQQPPVKENAGNINSGQRIVKRYGGTIDDETPQPQNKQFLDSVKQIFAAQPEVKIISGQAGQDYLKKHLSAAMLQKLNLQESASGTTYIITREKIVTLPKQTFISKYLLTL